MGVLVPPPSNLTAAAFAMPPGFPPGTKARTTAADNDSTTSTATFLNDTMMLRCVVCVACAAPLLSEAGAQRGRLAVGGLLVCFSRQLRHRWGTTDRNQVANDRAGYGPSLPVPSSSQPASHPTTSPAPQPDSTMGKKTAGSKTATPRKVDISPASPTSQSTSKRQRSGEDAATSTAKKVAPHATTGGGGDGSKEEEELVFEDPFGDEFDPEDIDAMNAEPEEDGDDDDGGMDAETGDAAASGSSTAATDAEGAAAPLETKVWQAGVDELAEGDELEYDSTAYHMYHSLRPEWPCLSFDVIRDSLGANRSRYPHTVFAVAGTQADRADNNRLQVC